MRTALGFCLEKKNHQTVHSFHLGSSEVKGRVGELSSVDMTGMESCFCLKGDFRKTLKDCSTTDIPMAQFIINLNASMPASQKFIIHILDATHLFVQPHVAGMIRSAISEFRDQNSYEKPA